LFLALLRFANLPSSSLVLAQQVKLAGREWEAEKLKEEALAKGLAAAEAEAQKQNKLKEIAEEEASGSPQNQKFLYEPKEVSRARRTSLIPYF
jgi:hypothetical protein